MPTVWGKPKLLIQCQFRFQRNRKRQECIISNITADSRMDAGVESSNRFHISIVPGINGTKHSQNCLHRILTGPGHIDPSIPKAQIPSVLKSMDMLFHQLLTVSSDKILFFVTAAGGSRVVLPTADAGTDTCKDIYPFVYRFTYRHPDGHSGGTGKGAGYCKQAG